ncbi:FAD-dependent monooxygenase [Streptomyces scabiei]|uniref:FAD-dependent oxidoreductase n=1 Tax=Streptomyces scabiei TaxID=1930 RepID=UPI0033E21772
MPATVPGPRIAIVGGGIGGLAAGAFLHQAGFTATVYEQAHAFTEVGAGLVMAPNAVRLLRRLGVMDQFLRRAVPWDWGWEFRRCTDGNVLPVEELSGVCERLYGERTYVVHRADLLDSLKAAVPSGWIGLGARCTAVDVRKNVVLLRFADGSQVEADIVIGADGVHSVVRGAVTEPSPPTYSGICAFRDRARPSRAWLRPAPCPDPLAGARTALRALSGRRWASRQRRRLRPGRELHRRILECDRHHRGVPARCLGSHTNDPEQGLKRYEAARIERTTRLQEISHARREINHLPDGPEQRARDAALAESDPLVRNGWIYGFDAEEAPTS